MEEQAASGAWPSGFGAASRLTLLPDLRRVLGFLDEYKAKYEATASQLAETCSVAFGVCHGDLHLGNLLCDPVTGQLTAVIDWESASWGPREADANEFQQMLMHQQHEDDENDHHDDDDDAEAAAGAAEAAAAAAEEVERLLPAHHHRQPIPASAGSWERSLLAPLLLSIRFLHFFHASWWGHFKTMEGRRAAIPNEAKEAEDTLRNDLRHFFAAVAAGPPPPPAHSTAAQGQQGQQGQSTMGPPPPRPPPLTTEEREVILCAVRAMENSASSFGHPTDFRLESKGITDSGALMLAEALPASRLEVLRLQGNQIGDAGAIALAKGLVGSKVKEIVLCRNAVGDVGAEAFAAALPSTVVVRIDLCDGFSVAKGKIKDGTKARLRDLKNKDGAHIQFD